MKEKFRKVLKYIALGIFLLIFSGVGAWLLGSSLVVNDKLNVVMLPVVDLVRITISYVDDG